MAFPKICSLLVYLALVPVKLWDMKVRASARILEKGVQDKLDNSIEEAERDRGNAQSWKGHSLAWARVNQQFNTDTGQHGFDRNLKPHAFWWKNNLPRRPSE